MNLKVIGDMYTGTSLGALGGARKTGLQIGGRAPDEFAAPYQGLSPNQKFLVPADDLQMPPVEE